VQPTPVREDSLRFRFVRGLARVLLRSQYRSIEVEDAERVPAEGAVLFVANHFGSLVDSLALLHAAPRPASFLAKAPLWSSRLLRPFLDAVGAVPVYRPQDTAENEGRGTRANQMTFEACRARLEAAGALAIFPEGVSQPQPQLMPVRTGAARIALDAQVRVHVVPVGLVYTHAARGGRGTLLVRFGRPFDVTDWSAFGSRRAAIADITRRIESALKDLIVEATSQGELAALYTMRVVWDQERGQAMPRTLVARHRRHRVFAGVLEKLRARRPERLDAMLAATDAYQRSLDLAGIPAELLGGRYTLGRVMHFILTKGVPTLLGLPLAWLAAAVTWPGRKLGDVVAQRSYGGTEDLRALCRMLGGGLLLALFTLVGAITALFLGGAWWAAGVLVGLPLLLAFHIAWQDHRRDVRTRINAFLLLAGAPLRRTLQEQRHALYGQLRAVAVEIEGAE